MAISNEATIRVKIDGREAEVSVVDLGNAIKKTMQHAKQEANKLKSSFDKIGNVSQKLFYTFKSLKMFVSGANSLTAASNKQEEAIAGFTRVMKSMGRYTDEAAEKIEKLASQIQSKGVIGDEDIMRGTKFLLTYKSISDDIMPRTMRAMADFAVLMDGDVASAATILGKASMGLTGELARYGITLSDQVKKSKDFKSILAEIEQQVGGQNRAMAQTESGSMRQFANTMGDLKEIGGDFIKTIVIPLQQLLKPVAEFIISLDKATQSMIGTIGIVVASLMGLAKVLKVFGLSARAALGPIGLIIAALELLYMAYKTNFLGIGDAIKTAWEYLKAFWNFVVNWAKRIGDIFGSLGGIIKGLLTLNKDEIITSWKKLTDTLTSSWDTAFKDIKENVRKSLAAPEPGEIVPKFGKLGNQAGLGFEAGFEQGREKGKEIYPKAKRKSLADEIEETFGSIEDIFSKKPKTENVLTQFEQDFNQFKETLNGIGLTAQNVFSTISDGMDKVSNRIVAAMWGAKVKFKDIWQGIAKDFTKLFVDEVLKIVAKKLVVQLIKTLALFDKASNDRMAMRIGQDYAKYFMQGVLGYMDNNQLISALATPGANFSDANIVNALNSSNRQLKNIENRLGNQKPVNIIKIDKRDIYDVVTGERTIEKIRLGEDVNEQPFK